MSWAGPAEALLSWAGPAETKESWAGPAETKGSWAGPAETKGSWAGPAETKGSRTLRAPGSERPLERTLRAPGTGAASGADSASSWDGSGLCELLGWERTLRAPGTGADSGADSASSWDGAGSGADSASPSVAPTVKGEPLSCSAVSIYFSNVQLGSCSGMIE